MGTPAYFQTIAKEITTGYKNGLYVDDKRKALVGAVVPRLSFRIENHRIFVQVDGQDLRFALPDDHRCLITHWNNLLMKATTLAEVQGRQKDLRWFLIEAIERHLIFRELSDPGHTSGVPDDKDDPNYVRDEEER